MASVVVNGDTSGAVTLTAPAVAGTVTVTLPAASGTMAALASVTANGVAYVNSSSQPTSGSALVFDGTNLGVGVTPSAWGTSNKAIDVASYVCFGYRSATNGTVIANNAYLTSGDVWTYKNTAAASAYQQIGGVHYWSVAASGTAGTTVTGFNSSVMTLDSSGNLGLNNTSPTTLITSIGGGGGKGIVISGQVPVLYFEDTNGTDASIFVENGDIAFVNGTTEAARFSSGNLLVGGTTSYGGNIQSISSYIRAANGTSSQNVGFVSSDQAGNEWHFGRSNVNGYYYVVRQTGTGMYMDTNSWVATSDIRAKENIVPLESSLSKINSLNPVRFTFKSDGMEDVGFIAQEMYEHIPDAVHKPEDEEAMMGISKEKIIPFLVKAIQEQQALITQLQADVAALKGVA